MTPTAALPSPAAVAQAFHDRAPVDGAQCGANRATSRFA
jgi:hypothetical protein